MGLKIRLYGCLVGGQLRRISTPQLSVAYAAARLHNASGIQVIEMHQYAWREAVEIAHPVGFVCQAPG